ncbi:Serine/threonine-protein kinase [Ceratobasidium sp. AG-Ba]|nr:Serine/threonine-protein kinase [Ceratobasidium sp. AG-Ba]
MQGTAHRRSDSQTINQRAQLVNAYQELGKELVSEKIRVIGNYTLGKVIGEGTYGKVRLGTHRLTQTRVAIKQIPKAHSAQLTREIHHHRRLHHKHITQLFEVIATESSIWLVTELCAGGELFDYLVEKGGRLTETEARRIVGELCLALDYVHREGAVHRDLKLENVLLDEKCSVKLGDFGFTREYEKGKFLDTFCGTTGYAAPEMLAGKKYLGAEVDVWSLGIILYCLLVGTLPFDDDDENVMRDKIIAGQYDIPDWLNTDAADLIVTLPTLKEVTPTESDPPAHPSPHPSPSTEIVLLPQPQLDAPPSRSSTLGFSPSKSVSGSDTTVYHSAASDLSVGSGASVSDDTRSDSRGLTTPTTSDGIAAPALEDDYPVIGVDTQGILVGNESETTLRKIDVSVTPSSNSAPSFEAVPETEEDSQNEEILVPRKSKQQTLAPLIMKRTLSAGVDGEDSQLRSALSRNHPPSSFPSRTPVRTKRRSISSTLSPPASPTSPTYPELRVDYLSELEAPVPVLFSTPLENELLERMSKLGLDASQIVHSVLSDACDSTGALWWMIKRKAEHKEQSRLRKEKAAVSKEKEKEKERPKKPTPVVDAPPETPTKPTAAPEEGLGLDLSPPPPPPPPKPIAPALSFVPATPTGSILPIGAKTPPTISPKNSYGQLSHSNSSLGRSLSPEAGSSRSTPTTPGQTKRTRSESGKGRSGSVSILQRASTALSTAVLVRKKSEENPRSRLMDTEETKPAKLTKLQPAPSEAPSEKSSTTPTSAIPASPWVLAGTSSVGAKSAATAPTDSQTPEESPEDTLSSLPRIASSSKTRQRASLLTAFRTWFQDDKKKRKDPMVSVHIAGQRRTNVSTPTSATSLRGRPRAAVRADSYKSRHRHHEHRVSVSSRRSSSANSRRSSVVSAHHPQLDGAIPISRQRSDASRHSIGTRTPTSERGDYPSRPSSIRSFSMTPVTPNMRRPRHSKSPSNSSAGSGRIPRRSTQSPLQQYHRRAGSGSSTKVVRQVKTVQTRHGRSGSAASSIRSVPNSRPTSFHEAFSALDSDAVATSYSNSPEPRRAQYTTTNFVAQKKPVTYAGVARTSWRKSWGTEPPGWSSKVIAHAPPRESESPSSTSTSGKANLRDVFTGRPSLSPDDEDEWTDEEEFLGGFGQNRNKRQLTTENLLNQSAGFSGSPGFKRMELPSAGSGTSLRVNTQRRGNRLSPLQNPSGLPPATSTIIKTEVLSGPSESTQSLQRTASGRRGNLQSGRGPGLRSNPIQEEEEEEEEE